MTPRRVVTACLAALIVSRLVAGWTSALADQMELCPDAPHRFESLSLFAPSLDRSKRSLVYLPPGYDCVKGRRYPVFYFNDGHDLFDWNPLAADLEPALALEIAKREGWYGSWRLASQLTRAVRAGKLPPMIIIGIASDDGYRSGDLAPVPWEGSSVGRGAQYGDFIAETVVPATDQRFHTVRDRRCRGIGGASLGGISALQIGLAHPDRFGLILSLSPVLTDPEMANYLAEAWPAADRSGPSTLLIDFDDDAVGTADLAWFRSVVGAAAEVGRRAILVQTPGGRHMIASWAERVIPALNQLVGAPCS